jgi:uncharacterized protein YbjT (DUF2867 family)
MAVMILVTGATGTTGREVVRELIALGAPVRAMGRNRALLDALFDDRADKCVAELGGSVSLQSALRGVSEAFLLTANSPAQREHEAEFLNSAKAAGVRRIVRLSAFGANAASAQLILRWHGEMDAALRVSGIPSTILYPHWFMQNMFKCVPPGQSEIYLPMKLARLCAIDVRDIAAVAAKLFTEPGYGAPDYTLSGPQSLNFAEIAAELSAEIGARKTYVAIPQDQFLQAVISAGQDEWSAATITDLFAGNIALGAQAELSGDVSAILGRDPISFRRFFADYRDGFALPAK